MMNVMFSVLLFLCELIVSVLFSRIRQMSNHQGDMMMAMRHEYGALNARDKSGGSPIQI